MESLVNNYINGNLKDSKNQSKKFSNKELREAFIEYAGYSFQKSQLIADWLKGSDCYQQACDAE